MTAVATPTKSKSPVVWIWLVLAVIAATSGILTRLAFPGPQLVILGLTALAIVVFRLDTVPLRWLIGVNALRLIGIVFLVLAAQGKLSPIFAARAGWGDIAVAGTAILLVSIKAPRGVLHLWNAVGALDLLVAVGSATFVTIRGLTPGVTPILTFPLSLVPAVAVPFFLANHLVIYRRLQRDER